jgi:myo-inositol-1(or 4)-monophosphatase
MTDLAARYTAARQIASTAGALALDYFRKWDQLTIDVKGHQDFVSEADRNVELAVRAALAQTFPNDGIVGEEGESTSGTSGYTWVIDPIDGTTNFINGIPQWCVIIACVHQGQTVIGVVHDPVHDEMHHAVAGGGAFCNDRPIRCSSKTSLLEGSLGVGFSGRREIEGHQAAGQPVLRRGHGVLAKRIGRAVAGLCRNGAHPWLCRGTYERLGLSRRSSDRVRGRRAGGNGQCR